MDASVKDGRRTRVSGIDRALQVLDVLREEGKPASAYAIAKAVGAPLSTVYSIIDDLVDKRMLQRRSDGTVWLGARLYHYGLAYAQSLDVLDVATHEMHDLCRAVGETVQICGLDDDHMIVLAMADGPGHFRVTSRVGTRVPLNWTASGRLLVGHRPQDELVGLYRRSVKLSPTGRAETDPAILAEQSREALADRLCIQMSESDFSVACIASPIRDSAGACTATISIVLPEHKVRENRDGYVAAVQEAAARIEAQLGWQ
ncbi:IclR family transcriptional regulator [uncultured Alsobacter sp.]|uniref:IclR family transcriptional regulator n=1 Tax=uncultured Alsobacter sp. TaxID=1748258 RepID=UPI0025D31C32|nr:IclR family transcriptional regulator [uncultured Alsobacter sp.]